VRLSQLEVVRAAELLYAIDARDHVNAFMADLGDKSDDSGALAALADVAAKYEDPRGMLLVGKLSLGRGHPLEQAAFPTVGLPSYTPIGGLNSSCIHWDIVKDLRSGGRIELDGHVVQQDGAWSI